MADEIDRKGLSEVEVAMLDALKTIIEPLITVYPNFQQYFAKSFKLQREGKIALKQPDAAAVFEFLRQFVTDPERQKAREQLAKILSEPPRGQA